MEMGGRKPETERELYVSKYIGAAKRSPIVGALHGLVRQEVVDPSRVRCLTRRWAK